MEANFKINGDDVSFDIKGKKQELIDMMAFVGTMLNNPMPQSQTIISTPTSSTIPLSSTIVPAMVGTAVGTAIGVFNSQSPTSQSPIPASDETKALAHATDVELRRVWNKIKDIEKELMEKETEA